MPRPHRRAIKGKPSPQPVGAPSLLTPERHKILLENIRLGVSLTSAIALAGVAKSTYYHWLKQAEKHPESIYADLVNDVLLAFAQFEADGVKAIHKAGKTNWQARAWLLQRNNSPRFGLPGTSTPPNRGETK